MSQPIFEPFPQSTTAKLRCGQQRNHFRKESLAKNDLDARNVGSNPAREKKFLFHFRYVCRKPPIICLHLTFVGVGAVYDQFRVDVGKSLDLYGTNSRCFDR